MINNVPKHYIAFAENNSKEFNQNDAEFHSHGTNITVPEPDGITC
jgi:hypothetical protein